MIILPTAIGGAFVVEPERHLDERGFFARTYCSDEMARAGIDLAIVQSSVSFNQEAGTLRGLHFQAPPHGEAKLVRCTAGSAFDVLVDLRPDSPTYRQVVTQELSAANRVALFAPFGVAHGFLTLEPATELLYDISTPHVPSAACAVRWDDPGLTIPWPAVPRVMSNRDRDLPDHVWTVDDER